MTSDPPPGWREPIKPLDEDFVTGMDVPSEPWTPEDVAFWTGTKHYQPWKDVAAFFSKPMASPPTQPQCSGASSMHTQLIGKTRFTFNPNLTGDIIITNTHLLQTIEISAKDLFTFFHDHAPASPTGLEYQKRVELMLAEELTARAIDWANHGGYDSLVAELLRYASDCRVRAGEAPTATAMEVRLGIEIDNLRERNANLDRLVKRLEGELAESQTRTE